MSTFDPPKFDPYEFLKRISGETEGESIMLTDQFRATDLGPMLKTALIAIELLAERVRELERKCAAGGTLNVTEII